MRHIVEISRHPGPGGAETRRTSAGAISAQDRAFETWPGDQVEDLRTDEATSWHALLDRYLAGWAEADPLTIIQATAPGYRLLDPLVGLFTRWSLPQYFERLQAQRPAAAVITQAELAVVLHGPIDPSSHRLDLQFWRRASAFGATGLAHIAVGERGVMSEVITYDVGPPREPLRPRTIRHAA